MPLGDGVAVAEPYVVAVHLVKGQRRQVVRTRIRRSGGCNKKEKKSIRTKRYT